VKDVIRIAVFTSQFPGLVNTFFARDMRALIDAGIDVDIFPLYPLNEKLWRYVPDCLCEDILSRSQVHHLDRAGVLGALPRTAMRDMTLLLREAAVIGLSAVRYGAEPLMKSCYAVAAAAAWARSHDGFDHVLAYWGNYPSTAAYLFHRLTDRSVPYSTFLHAGTDLYRNPVFLRQKLLAADRIFVVCEYNRAFLQHQHRDIYDRIASKIVVHHLGLDLDEFQYQQAGRASNRVLAVGSFNDKKGFDQLIRAAHFVGARGVDVEVELVGDGPEAAALARLARGLGIERKVRFRGWVTPDEVRAAMLDATMLVHPSTGLGDAVPTVIKEALALGTPVVASDVAGIPELLNGGRCGVLVPPRDAAALSFAIEKLLTEPAERARLAAAGRAHAERMFDLALNGPRLAELLRSTSRLSLVQPSQQPAEI
jgi:glycosyltransferase involved in cell wall biosynthesis